LHARLSRLHLAPTEATSPAPAPGRLPGIGRRFLAGVAHDAAAHGWSGAELTGLVAAAEERSRLWLITPGGRVLSQPEVREWDASRYLPCDNDVRGLILTVAASQGRNLCLSAISGTGRKPARIAQALGAAGALSGHVDDGVAEMLEVRWAVELLVAPLLTRETLSSLRDVLSAAPRCGWCGVPVLGSRCRRCTGDVT
jgi:hypothetical protein